VADYQEDYRRGRRHLDEQGQGPSVCAGEVRRGEETMSETYELLAELETRMTGFGTTAEEAVAALKRIADALERLADAKEKKDA